MLVATFFMSTVNSQSHLIFNVKMMTSIAMPFSLTLTVPDFGIMNDKNDFQLVRLFVTTIREFFASTSLHGFKYLIQPGRSTFEKCAWGRFFFEKKKQQKSINHFFFVFSRLIWYGIQLCALASAAYIFLYAFDGFVAKPTFTSLDSLNYPIWEIPYPAVAICSVNLISKRAAMDYAMDLYAYINFFAFQF